MSEPVLDFRSAFSIVRRHRGVVVAAGLVGLVAGLLLVMARPPLYDSSTLVLLPPQETSDGQVAPRDMVTETGIVTSDAVLGPARKHLGGAMLSGERLAQLVTAESPSQNMVLVNARGKTARAAEALAQAVAASEVQYQLQASSSLSNAELAALDARQSRLQAQLAVVNREITRTKVLLANNPPDSSQAGVAQSALSQLAVQQTNLALALDGIRSQREGRQTGPGATIVQSATPAERPRLVEWLAVSALLGMLVAAGLAAAVVVALARRDPRLRTRDEIADALGSPVIGSLKSHPARTTAGWSVLLESYRPSTVDAWALRQILDHVGAGRLLAAVGHPGAATDTGQLSLVLVLMAEDPAALAVAAQLASHTASLGVSTRLTALQRHAFADPLWATTTMRGSNDEVRPGLRVDPRRRKTSADLVVNLAVVDRRQPALPDLRRMDAVVLIVSSGTATEADLARVALVTYESGSRFRGVVVADPDSLDRTTGRLLQAQRAVEPPMPAKLVGVDGDEWLTRGGGLS